KDSPEAKGFETLRREISRFPADYKESPSKKLTKEQFESYAKMEALEKQVTAWEKTKEKIKKMLWWDDVAKGLAKLNQQNDTSPENGETTDTTTSPADTTPLATLSADGKAWFIHPVAMGAFIANDSMITMEMLIASHPTGVKSYYAEILPYLNQYALVYGLVESKEIAHFLSQIGHESGFKSDSEKLYFSSSRMKQVYGCKGGKYNQLKDSCDLGQLRPKLWTNTSYYERNPENLANYVYANRMGNGDESSGDGYRYRGRGMIQLTGKDAYNNFTNVHNKNNPDDIQDFVANPDLLISSTQYGIESAFVFWFTKTGRPNRDINHFVKLKDLAKSGTVQEVTQLVNGGQNGYNDRKQRFNRLARLLGLDEE
ncbi:glycoside hydrolase family 19 protein, partial [Gilliamella sp. HK7]|uniref:glycoside hydrolase family 19 protein n=2 Tax=unclassified Gilliamella TaxID=2685620 RepID=UPI001C400ABC